MEVPVEGGDVLRQLVEGALSAALHASQDALMLHLDGTRELRNTRQQDLRQEQQRPGLNLRQGTLKSPEQSRSRPPERRIGRTNNSRTKERIHAGSRPSSVRVKALDGAAIIPNIPRAPAGYFIGLAEVRPSTKHIHYFATLFVGTQASRRSHGVHEGHLISDALPVVH